MATLPPESFYHPEETEVLLLATGQGLSWKACSQLLTSPVNWGEVCGSNQNKAPRGQERHRAVSGCCTAAALGVQVVGGEQPLQ